MMKASFVALIAILITTLTMSLLAQDKTILTGEVSFVTTQNSYVKFGNTDLIEIGDTLQLTQNGTQTPCLVVTQKSSNSCVCTTLNGCTVEKGDALWFGVFAIGCATLPRS